MKKLIVLQIFVFISQFYSQTSSLDSALAYLPLHEGNYWEYGIYSGNFPSDPDTAVFFKVVRGDTLLDNGKRYIIIEKKYFKGQYSDFDFLRIDSLNSNVFKYDPSEKLEFRIDSLLSEPGDSISASRFGPVETGEKTLFCLEKSETLVFGENRAVKKNSEYSFADNYYLLAKGIGKIYDYAWEGNFWIEKLFYAEIDGVEYGIKTDIVTKETQPMQFRLFNNYPNPFNPTTRIKFTVSKRSEIKLIVYNLLGQEIQILFNGLIGSGEHEIEFDGSNLSSGTYIFRLVTSEGIYSKKMLLIK